MKTKILKKLLTLTFIALLTNCTQKEISKDNKDTDLKAETSKKDKSFKAEAVKEITPEVVSTIKVKGEKAIVKITSSGVVQPSEQGIANVVSPINGLVEKMYINIGNKVTKDMILLKLKSVDVNDIKSGYLATVSDTKSGVLTTKNQLEEAKRLFNLNKELFKVGAISKNDLIASENNLKQLEITLKGYQEKLQLHESKDVHDFILKAPISGTVYELNVHNGDRVQNDPTQPLIKIVNDNLLVVANVYDKDLKTFTKGKKVQITSDINPNVKISGTINYISDVVDPETKTIKVFIKPDTSKGLKLNMYVKIISNEEQGLSFKIPKKTIVYKESKLFVFKKQGAKYALNPIEIIDDSNPDFALVKGLNDDDEIAKEAILLEKE